MKGVWIRVGFALPRDKGFSNGKEVIAVIAAKEVVVHLLLQKAGSIVWTPAERGNTHCSSAPIHYDEETDDIIAF